MLDSTSINSAFTLAKSTLGIGSHAVPLFNIAVPCTFALLSAGAACLAYNIGNNDNSNEMFFKILFYYIASIACVGALASAYHVIAISNGYIPPKCKYMSGFYIPNVGIRYKCVIG